MYRNQQRDRQLVYTDKSLSTFSDSSCQHACDVEREFLCRSYTFLSTVSQTNLQFIFQNNFISKSSVFKSTFIFKTDITTTF